MLNLKIKNNLVEEEVDKDIVYIPIELVNEFIVNPLGSLRDFASIPTNAISPFFTDIDKLDRCLVPWNPFDSNSRTFTTEFTCTDDFFRYVHIDLGWKKDGLGIAMCHVPYWTVVKRVIEDKEKSIFEEVDVQQPFIKFDFVGRIKAETSSEILISTAQDLILELAYQKNFYIHLITFDRFESVQTMQTLREKGFNVAHLSVDRTSHKIIVDYDRDDFIRRDGTDKQYNAALECLRYAIQEDRASIPHHEDWEQETRGLEYLADKNKVVKSPHSSDDLVQAIAGAAFNASNNEMPDFVGEKQLPEDVKDKKYEEMNWQTQYDYSQEISPDAKFSNYRIGIG